GPSQLARILIAESIRSYLMESEANTLEVHWCPSHRGFVLNEFVDAEAKRALEAGDCPDFVSYSYAKSQITRRAVRAWRRAMRAEEYRGRHNLLPKKVWDKMTHTAKHHPILKLAGGDNRLMAKVVRFVSGHAPTETFRHIVAECPL
ncbi:hypothetical protein K474DRAFT_1667920, partial [Panus rudis PR-1116 ss-1]